jgi:hypothetical protein
LAKKKKMAPIRTEKPIRTEQEMFPLIESWLKSKLTQKEFSQKHKLPLHILPYWIGRYQKAHSLAENPAPTSTTASFIQLTPPVTSARPTPTLDPTTPATIPKGVDSLAEHTLQGSTVDVNTGSSAMEMEVAFPSGVRIHFSSLVPVSYLQELVSVCFR